ncbi:FMN-binding protein [Pseudonocardia carboxydivorans]|uniref:FMN-binding protein n=1 Tax=Pseudonocardia alni subsp. carboxydivorans TaxID=415010 RepID=A0ABU9A942_PSEA5
MSPVRRIVVAVMATLSAVTLVLGYRTSTSAPDTTTAAAPTVRSPGTTSTPGGTVTGSGSGSTTVPGDTAQTRYGPVQVQVSVSGGRITAVDVLQYPDSSGTDRRINSQAIPQLVDETLGAQSSRIDMVSGATYTSDGYVTSLQSALDRAELPS